MRAHGSDIWTQAEVAEQAEAAGGRPTEHVAVSRVSDRAIERSSDVVAAEEPLEIRIDGARVAVTMRTPAPGQDAELAVGFLLGEGIVTAADVAGVSECRTADGDGGIADVRLLQGASARDGWQRSFYATSSCGICGKASIDAVRVAADPVEDGPLLDRQVLLSLPGTLRAEQAVFERTGGLHAAGLFGEDGALRLLREDVGRHNAVDKLLGRAAMDDTPRGDGILLVSGRASFEIVQKGVMAGIPVVAAVSAPSSLAVRLAREMNQTLIGFLREGAFNVYAGAGRIDT
jgi:FdhD protein